MPILGELLHKKFCCTPLQNDQHICLYQLTEDDPESNHKQFEIKSLNNQLSIVVFISDYKRNGKSANILQYFNSEISNLTKIPDYIVFVENQSGDVFAIVVEMKSETLDNAAIKAKFKNGSAIAKFIMAVTGKSSRGVKWLLSRTPKKARKSVVHKSNDVVIAINANGWIDYNKKSIDLKHVLALFD